MQGNFFWLRGRRDGQRVWPVNRGLDPDGSTLEKGLAFSIWNIHIVTHTSMSLLLPVLPCESV